jgi:monothiol glutaredoxin
MTIRLFIKPGCPWCHEAIDWFVARGLEFQRLNVLQDEAHFAEMRRLTGQSKAPCVQIDGKVLADFDTKQLEAWWSREGLPAVSPRSRK